MTTPYSTEPSAALGEGGVLTARIAVVIAVKAQTSAESSEMVW